MRRVVFTWNYIHASVRLWNLRCILIKNVFDEQFNMLLGELHVCRVIILPRIAM